MYDNDEILIPFVEATLKKCQESAAKRAQYCRKSKYNKIVLPAEIDGVIGYHPQCYKGFNASVKGARSMIGLT